MTRGTIKLSKPVYNIELDFDEHSLEANGFVRVIRCKDCKFFYKTYANPYCALWSRLDSELPKETDFCSWAERKEE